MTVYDLVKKKNRRVDGKLKKKKFQLENKDKPVPLASDNESNGSSEDKGEIEGNNYLFNKTNGTPAVDEAAQVIEFNEPAQWVERMALTSTRALPADLNADDDPKREEAFIQQTLLSVAQGISMLESAGVPWKRPDDYYAEMYKSDTHMNDVRHAMEAAKAHAEAQSHRRAMKDQKKYGKEIQAEVLRQRAKYKRDMQDRLNDWKKKRKGDGALQDFLNNDDGGEDSSQRRRPEPRSKNLRPGGKSKRPGKTARRRQ